jgi:hypothetical protein
VESNRNSSAVVSKDLNKLARLSHIIAVKFDVVCSASFVESIGRHLEIASFRMSTLKKENAQSQHLDKPFIRSLAKRIVNLSKLVTFRISNIFYDRYVGLRSSPAGSRKSFGMSEKPVETATQGQVPPGQ